jgi:predicted metal-dependent enzyme (double-stranded beta helix superfamily)
MRAAWGPLTTELVAESRRQIEKLLRASPSEAWLADLHADRPASRELYRDPDHGFMLLAHTEHAGLFRPPHDHGRGWVIYAMQQGEIEMRTYARVGDGLVQRDSALMRADQALVYLPGDIHDTRCVSESALLLRFTDRDLKAEDRMTRYVDQGGVWTPAAR